MKGCLLRKSKYTGATKVIILVVVCAYIAISLLKIGSSLLLEEDSIIQSLRGLSLLTSIIIGVLVWKGYVWARMVLATWLTCVGCFLFYTSLATSLPSEHFTLYLVIGPSWILFGMTLFFINRIGRAIVG